MVVNGELRMDRWCPKIRDLGEAELQKIQEWITGNTPPQVLAFWNKQGRIT
jgi:hypothetical protein